MFSKILFGCFATFLFVLLQSIVPVSSQSQQSNPEVRPFTDLTFEIATTTERFLPFQPIPITLKQSNKTNQPVLGYKAINFNSPVYFYVQKIGGEKVQISQLTTLSPFTSFKNSEISPGTSIEAKNWLTLSLNKYFFEPGTYELYAELESADGTQFIVSNKINIEIKEPAGLDREAYNLIKNNPFNEYLFSDADFDKVQTTLEAIKTRFPNSGYAKSAFYLLGERYFDRKQYPKALANLIRLENDRDFIFASKVKNYLAQIRELESNEKNNY
jgi:hypothetical protein